MCGTPAERINAACTGYAMAAEVIILISVIIVITILSKTLYSRQQTAAYAVPEKIDRSTQ